MRTQKAIDAFVLSREAKGLTQSSLKWYRSILTDLGLTHTTLPRDATTVENWIVTRTQGLSSARKAGYHTAIRALFKFCSARYDLPDPTANIPRPKLRKTRRRYLTPDQLRRVLAAARTPRDYALILLLVDTGIRIGEAATLTWNHILPDGLLIQGKSDERYVPCSPVTIRALQATRTTTTPWTTHAGNRPIGRIGLTKAVRRCLQRAGIQGEKTGPHLLRHSFGRAYLTAGGDTESLRQLLGHSSITTTQIYAELAPEQLRQQHHHYSPATALATATHAMEIVV